MRTEGNASGGRLYSSRSSSASSDKVSIGVQRSQPAAKRKPRAAKAVEDAVYTYIRAVRALGRENITTGDIAAALGLSIATVNDAIASLTKKGVKVV